jgi:N-acetylglucosaminyldiphosphoundecaprenol N-acetyl-beta-D-mannosaminyltransferase
VWADPAAAPSITILGVRIHLVNAQNLINIATRTAQTKQRTLLAYVNAHGMNLAHEQPRLRRFFNDCAQWVFCDGFGVRWGARLAGQPAPERFTPRDWIDALADACARHGLSMYLLGSPTDTAQRAADALVARHANLHIAGTHHGFFDKQRNAQENLRVIDHINTSKADVLLVGFGMPMQEYWLEENWPSLHASVGIAVGGLFGLLAGTLWRPPKWMTDHGLEWAGRLMVEPKRLWRRYLIGNPQFLARILRERLRR